MISLLLFLAGLACIVMGVTLISVPAAWITAGGGLIAVAVIWAKGGGQVDNLPPEPPALKEPPQRGSSIQNIGRRAKQ